MKALLVIAVLCATAYAARLDFVSMISSTRNDNGVLIVWLKADGGTLYKVTCNVDESSCRFPAKGKTYELRDSDNKFYSCQNVELIYGITETLGPYCLRGVE